MRYIRIAGFSFLNKPQWQSNLWRVISYKMSASCHMRRHFDPRNKKLPHVTSINTLQFHTHLACLLGKLGIKDIEDVLCESRMRWLGHVKRSTGWIARVRERKAKADLGWVGEAWPSITWHGTNWPRRPPSMERTSTTTTGQPGCTLCWGLIQACSNKLGWWWWWWFTVFIYAIQIPMYRTWEADRQAILIAILCLRQHLVTHSMI